MTEQLQHKASTGYLLVGTGTPDDATLPAVRRYLDQFLMDARIISVPSILRRFIVNRILESRPQQTVKVYEEVRLSEGLPFRVYSQGLLSAMREAWLAVDPTADTSLLKIASRYGQPSIADALRQFSDQAVQKVKVLPLYPQQAFCTTYSVLDELERLCKSVPGLPQIELIYDYHLHPTWLQAVADSILAEGLLPTHLLFSFHSIPLKDQRHGDIYIQQVVESCQAITRILGLDDTQWSIAYQSRFDKARSWQGPFLEAHINDLLRQGVKRLLIATPGFAVDCTETLYDIDKQIIQKLGDNMQISRISCMNDSPAHAQALLQVLGVGAE